MVEVVWDEDVGGEDCSEVVVTVMVDSVGSFAELVVPVDVVGSDHVLSVEDEAVPDYDCVFDGGVFLVE